jgi:hypothetical protein
MRAEIAVLKRRLSMSPVTDRIVLWSRRRRSGGGASFVTWRAPVFSSKSSPEAENRHADVVGAPSFETSIGPLASLQAKGRTELATTSSA